MGRAPEIVNIPIKPTPKGFKIWVLANQGYALDWLQHAKGDKKGPINLNESFLKEGFLKTQAVMLDLLTQYDPITGKRLYPLGKHVVWLNNLFTSIQLFKRLRSLGIRAAGTVRTIYIKRKEIGDEAIDIKEVVNKNIEARTKGKKKVPAKAFLARLMDLKKTYKDLDSVGHTLQRVVSELLSNRVCLEGLQSRSFPIYSL